MARIAQPREIAELKGATRKHPERYRSEPLKSKKPLGDPPTHLNDDQRATWLELEGYALPGILTGADRFAMETLSVLLAQFRKAPDSFPSSKMSCMQSLVARMGFQGVLYGQ